MFAKALTFVVGLLALTSSIDALGQKKCIAFSKSSDSLALVSGSTALPIYADAQDWPGVLRAAGDLSADFKRVTGKAPATQWINGTSISGQKQVIIVGTVGKSKLIDQLASSGKINVKEITGKWESFKIQLVQRPFPGVDSAFVIAGSDKRGSIYGIYDISEQIGVSPWYWYADVPAQKHSSVYALNTVCQQGEPSIKYRGIFLNDEQPALTNWVYEKWNTTVFGSGFYTTVFELLLRLKANYLWPTMWNSMFNVDDDHKNQILADMYGIVMSTSHQEPMMRSTPEWNKYGTGPWAYTLNNKTIYNFWVEGAQRAKPYESYYVVGMRGNGDEPMSEGQNIGLLEKIVADQREILAKVYNTTDLSTIPQSWCLYKEVQGYYEDGMRVPDDITLLWADDNWGNIRRLPSGNETARKGGAGVYYHFDYVGDPRSYKWINTNQVPKVWEQLHLAYEREARQIWLVNVGDLKPLEIPINFFMDMAWDVKRWDKKNLAEWHDLWAEREFGSKYAKEISGLVQDYTRYVARKKHELLNTPTFSMISYHEDERILEEWNTLVAKSTKIYRQLDSDAKPAYFQLVQHPIDASRVVNELYIKAFRSVLWAGQGRNTANALAGEVEDLFQEDHDLTQKYHTLLDGKWNHMMSQTHLGYVYWQQPMRQQMPPVGEVQIKEMGLPAPFVVTWEDSLGVWPGDNQANTGAFNNFVVPTFDRYGPQTKYVDVSPMSPNSFTWNAYKSVPWIKLSQTSGKLNRKSDSTRVQISIDWNKVPEGTSTGTVYFNSTYQYQYPQTGMTATGTINVRNQVVPSTFKNGFIEGGGVVAIEAEHWSRNKKAGNYQWEVIPGYGRTLSGVAPFPVVSENTWAAGTGPALEYDIYLFTLPANKSVQATLHWGTGLNQNFGRPLKYAVAIDDETPQVVQIVPNTPPGGTPPDWAGVVRDSVRYTVTNHTLAATGKHTLKIWAVEPATVLQRVVINTGGLMPSFLGPPESKRV
ncbi:hypothetical protein HDV00_001961 [Rhizophlyctis rosea]|nr:hypothetical protein HDV00_001961 [Rhizophlyctis rosea]